MLGCGVREDKKRIDDCFDGCCVFYTLCDWHLLAFIISETHNIKAVRVCQCLL